MIAAKVMAQVVQYINHATTCKNNTWVFQKLEDVFKSFSDNVLKQQKEVKESFQAAKSLLEKRLHRNFCVDTGRQLPGNQCPYLRHQGLSCQKLECCS
jgi:hypothetical protein